MEFRLSEHQAIVYQATYTMNHRYLFLLAALLGSLSATAQTTPPAAKAPTDTLTSPSEPSSEIAATPQLPWWLPTAAQCADIRALEAEEAPAQAARRKKRMQRQSKKLGKMYPPALEQKPGVEER